jgi:hypothetical protein
MKSSDLSPVRDPRGAVGDRVRLRRPSEWGTPGLDDPAAVPSEGFHFRVQMLSPNRVEDLQWLPVMSELAAARSVGVLVRHDSKGVLGDVDAKLPVVDFDGSDGPFGTFGWRFLLHPDWVEWVDGDPLGPACSCPSRLLLAGCTCGRAFRERAARQTQQDRSDS